MRLATAHARILTYLIKTARSFKAFYSRQVLLRELEVRNYGRSIHQSRKADLAVGVVEEDAGVGKKRRPDGPTVVVHDDQQRAHGVLPSLLKFSSSKKAERWTGVAREAKQGADQPRQESMSPTNIERPSRIRNRRGII